MTRGLKWAAILSLGALALGCSGESTCPKCDGPTQGASEEATLIAIYLTGALTAPPSIADSVDKELRLIRTTFAQQYSVVTRLTFEPPWVPSRITLLVDAGTARAIQDSTYTAWDSLNAKYNVVEIRTQRIDRGYCTLQFSEILHPFRLADVYGELPGVLWVLPTGRVGDGPKIYPGTQDAIHTYLFRDAWGDCPAGCIHSRYWYFAVRLGVAWLIGEWDPDADPERPWWWNGAYGNIERYRAG